MTESPTRPDAHGTAREDGITAEVIASFDATTDSRLREVMQALVRHTHAFAREVRLTEAEWQQAITFLTHAGEITDDNRQEFILLSDVLGLSALTVAINQPPEPTATSATVFGPFFVHDAPEIQLGGDIAQGAKGVPCYVSGRIAAPDGAPVPRARIEIWEADEDGFYDVQYPDGRRAGRGWITGADDGTYRFWSVLPSPYPIPHDGPVGAMLEAVGREPWRPAHLHFMIKTDEYHTLVTHIFLAEDQYLDTDAVFGVRNDLIVTADRHHGGIAPDGSEQRGDWASIEFDFVLTTRVPESRQR